MGEGGGGLYRVINNSTSSLLTDLRGVRHPVNSRDWGHEYVYNLCNILQRSNPVQPLSLGPRFDNVVVVDPTPPTLMMEGSVLCFWVRRLMVSLHSVGIQAHCLNGRRTIQPADSSPPRSRPQIHDLYICVYIDAVE